MDTITVGSDVVLFANEDYPTDVGDVVEIREVDALGTVYVVNIPYRSEMREAMRDGLALAVPPVTRRQRQINRHRAHSLPNARWVLRRNYMPPVCDTCGHDVRRVKYGWHELTNAAGYLGCQRPVPVCLIPTGHPAVKR